jgi:hypothetical protein
MRQHCQHYGEVRQQGDIETLFRYEYLQDRNRRYWIAERNGSSLRRARGQQVEGRLSRLQQQELAYFQLSAGTYNDQPSHAGNGTAERKGGGEC